jgi:hypothetical protein
MSFDPDPAGTSTRKASAPDPAREVEEMARLLGDSAGNLAAASESVGNGSIARSLADMSQTRRRAADTVMALAADAGVVVRVELDDAGRGAIAGDGPSASGADDAAVIEELLTKDDRLMVRLDVALGGDLPPAVKDQIRLTGAQVRDGLRSMAGWV